MGGCRVPHPKPALSVVEGPALAWVGILLGSWGRRLAQRPITQAPVVSPRFAYLPRHSAVTWASAITPGLRKPVEDKRRLKLNRLIHSFGILDYRGDGEQVGSAPSVEGTPLGGPLSPRCRTEAKSIWLRTRPVNRVLPLTFTFNFPLYPGLAPGANTSSAPAGLVLQQGWEPSPTANSRVEYSHRLTSADVE